MKPLSKELRNKFERTIENAREIAEEAARIALEQLGVGEASPYSYLSEDERALRRRLRAHGRNLGDVRDPKTETQEIDRLIEEIAYEHWHRMLFARFLAENDLLMYYEDDDIENAVPVTLSECDELAQELEMKNGWEVAAKLATKMLPQVFRADSPVFEVQLPFEKLKKLESLISDMEYDIFASSDSIGWAYQFWKNKEKEKVNDSQGKIGSKELSAVTQLFTEPYMVDFILNNTIGAWWAHKRLTANDLNTAKTEDELRKKLELPGLYFESLRFIRGKDNVWKIAGESICGWPDDLSSIKILDPCCGSGHFLVAVLLKLIPIRSFLEDISFTEACDSILKDNIFGLEIDKRCVEIAVFALALNAWRYSGTKGFRRLPDIKVAYCGQPIAYTKKQWLDFSNGNSQLRIYLEEIYNAFSDAPTLGSLIDPIQIFSENSLFSYDYETRYLVSNIIERENNTFEVGLMAKGFEQVYKILSNKYHFILTNVPYLARGKQNNVLTEFCDKNYPDSKWDLAAVFVERCQKLLVDKGSLSIVLPQQILFSHRYKNFRKNSILDFGIDGCVRLGSGAFSSISGEVVKVCLLMLAKSKFKYSYLIDANELSSIEEKADMCKKGKIQSEKTRSFYDNPDYRILFDRLDGNVLLEKYADCYQGVVTGDTNRFIYYFWEIPYIDNSKWMKYRKAPTENDEGLNSVIKWECGKGELHKYAEETRHRLHDMHESGKLSWNKKGVAIGRISRKVVPYYGEIYDNSVAVVTPKMNNDLSSIFSFTQSEDFQHQLTVLDQKLSITNATILKVGYDKKQWTNRNIFPSSFSNDCTQWVFHGNPSKSVDPLQVAVVRLLGYRWPAELDDKMELSDEARNLVAQSQSLLPYVDKNGIVCIPSVRGEAPASERLLNLLAAAYKDEDINMILAELLSNADHAGKSLESWLRDKFFTQHYKLFGHRPFIWQIWDGLKDGFSVLVNYHKLDRKNLETLIYTYLGDWISKQKSAMMDGIEGAEEKLNAAISLKKKLELILEGESPYDIFVRWKPLNEQPLGWEPDLNDGVRVNIRPFMLVEDVGKKGAGVLRDKPNIKWNKDRGKDTENSPWYHLFGGDRINDHHLTLEEKKKAREDEVKFR
ncbi:hypothetical protein A7W90_09295 [Clostridium sp. Bc-iso-3]|nr:hypothetical protein A7W90_09295 [Clostridium sp. Bc-iso-3]